MSDSTPPPVRAEARPFSFQQLGKDQKDAVRGLLKHLRHVRDGAKSAPLDPIRAEFGFLPLVDKQRSNNSLLIDGARGTGKTSVMLTVIELLSKVVLNSDGVEDDLKSLELDRRDLAGVVPIGLIDMEALAPGASFTLRLCAHFLAVVEALDGERPDDGIHSSAKRAQSRGWDPQAVQELASRRCWRKLIEAVVAAESTVSAASELTLRVREEEEAMLSRRDVANTFRSFVDALRKDYEHHYRLRPVFVIAIDDADLNASRVREVMHWMRTWVHPSVAYILSADRGLLQRRLHEVVASEVPKIKWPWVEDDVYLGMRKQDLELVEAMWLKAFPSGQSFQLSLLPLQDRIQELSRFTADRLLTRMQRFPVLANALPGTYREIEDLRGRLARDPEMTLAKVLQKNTPTTEEDYIELFSNSPHRVVAPGLCVSLYPAASARGESRLGEAALGLLAVIEADPIPVVGFRSSPAVLSGISWLGTRGWPLPPFRTHLHHLGFMGLWNELAASARSAMDLVQAYVRAVAYVMSLADDEVEQAGWSESGLLSFEEALRRLDSGSGERSDEQMQDWWHREGILITAPEAGLPIEIANQVLSKSSSALAKLGPESLAAKERRRALRRGLPASARGDLDKVWQRLSQGAPESLFIHKIEGRVSLSSPGVSPGWEALLSFFRSQSIGGRSTLKAARYAAVVSEEWTRGWTDRENEAVLDALRGVEGKVNFAAPLVVRLWRALTKAGAVPRGLADLVSYRDRAEGGLEVGALASIWTAGNTSDDVWFEGETKAVRWRILPVAPRRLLIPEELTSSAARAVLVFAHEVANETKGSPAALTVWPGFELMLRKRVCRWVAPYWSTLTDANWLVQGWNDQTDGLRLNEATPRERVKYLDGLFEWWYQANVARVASPSEVIPFAFEERPNHYEDVSIHEETWRGEAVPEFRNLRFGFAAPDLGLSQKKAEEILRPYTQEPPKYQTGLLPPLEAFKVISRSPFNPAVRLPLRTELPNHPWYKIVDRDHT